MNVLCSYITLEMKKALPQCYLDSFLFVVTEKLKQEKVCPSHLGLVKPFMYTPLHCGTSKVIVYVLLCLCLSAGTRTV